MTEPISGSRTASASPSFSGCTHHNSPLPPRSGFGKVSRHRCTARAAGATGICARPRTASSRVLGLRVVTTAKLPTGTVTFLFSDIEGSTKLLSELGDDYAHVLLAHRRKLRNAFSGHRGFEVDTQGDAFFYAFAHASEAVAAAQEAQATLAEGPV